MDSSKKTPTTIKTLLPMDFIPKKLALKNCISGCEDAKLGTKGLPVDDKPKYVQLVNWFKDVIKNLDFNSTGYLSQGTLPYEEYFRFLQNFSVCVNEIQNIQNIFLGREINLQTMEIQIAYATMSIPWTVAYHIQSSDLNRETLDYWFSVKRSTIHIQLNSLNLEEKNCPLFRFQAVDRVTGRLCFVAPNCFILNNGGKKNTEYISDYSKYLFTLVSPLFVAHGRNQEQWQEAAANAPVEGAVMIQKRSRSQMEQEEIVEEGEVFATDCTLVEEPPAKSARMDDPLTDLRIDLEFDFNSDSTEAVMETPTSDTGFDPLVDNQYQMINW